MSKYKFRPSTEFIRLYKKYSKSNKQLEGKIDNAIAALLENPFSPSLRTHLVNTRSYGKKYSSRITGDLRLIWDFSESRISILALAIGGHSGKKGVY